MSTAAAVPRHRATSRSRVLETLPPTLYAVPFGLAGLGLSWCVAQPLLGVPAAIADGLFLMAALLWGALTYGLVARAIRSPGAVAAELRDPRLSPFFALPGVVALVLSLGLLPHAPGAAKVVALVALGATLLAGGWLSGAWMDGGVDVARSHPGCLLPTVAGGFLGANVTAVMGFPAVAAMSFGIGVLSWLLLGSTVLNRRLHADQLPDSLVPTLAIVVAPPAVGGNAYFAMHPGPDDLVSYGLAGYLVLMVLVQVRLVPLYRRLSFGPTFWSFTFSYTAVATYVLHLIERRDPHPARLLGWLTLGVITIFVGAIAVKSLKAIAAQRFFAPAAPASVR